MAEFAQNHHVGTKVDVSEALFVHDTAVLHGTLKMGKGCSIWPYVVTRAEMQYISIGDGSNIQDFVMIHVGVASPTVVGSNCSITHRATLHGCTIEDDCLIGIGATVMDGAHIGRGSIVAGHSIVTEGKHFPAHSVIAGVPAKLVATKDNTEANRLNARFYQVNAAAMAEGRDILQPSEVDLFNQDLTS